MLCIFKIMERFFKTLKHYYKHETELYVTQPMGCIVDIVYPVVSYSDHYNLVRMFLFLR